MAGSLFVISAPSGAGKSTVIKLLLKRARCPRLDYSVSYTTRAPRPGEVNGQDYVFVSQEEFLRLVREDGFLEWVKVFDNFYGTSQAWVNQKLAADRDVLVEVDVVGAKSLKERFPKAVMIFMVPPNRHELIRRLTFRRTEDPLELERRVAQSSWEIEQRRFFDYLVVNDDLTVAAQDVESLILGRGERQVVDEASFWPKFFAPNP
ncbi:MAG: guanylate kinase [Deltaproteobacteria bacterium]|jgi:guanylate kinase|nr:guanylate kinase [Deltaproteobacteria bacterium]